MSYEKLKQDLTQSIQDYYVAGTPINDIRAALHATDLLAEQYGAIELMEMARSMPRKDATCPSQ